jgi:hypothetical protein
MTQQRESLLQLEQEIGVYRVKREHLRRSRLRDEVSGFLMQDAVTFHQQLQKLAVSPFDYLPSVGQSLLRHPQIRLRHLSYRLHSDEVEGEGDVVPAPAALSPLDRMAARGSEVQKHPLALLQLEGEIEAGGRSYRQIHQDFTRWLQGLRERGGFSGIRVERWPLEIRPDRSLVMEGAPAEGSHPLRFSLTLSGRALL